MELNVNRKVDHLRYFGGSLELVSLDGWGKINQPGDILI